MQSRTKDFQLPVHVQPVVVVNSEVTTGKVEKLYKNNTKPTIRPYHRKPCRWRNVVNSCSCHFCVQCWVSSKRNLVRKIRRNYSNNLKQGPGRRTRRNATLFRKKIAELKIDTEYINSSKQGGTGNSFIDDIFRLIK